MFVSAYFNIPHRAGKIYGYFLALLIFLRNFPDSIRKYLYKNTEKRETGKKRAESGKFPVVRCRGAERRGNLEKALADHKKPRQNRKPFRRNIFRQNVFDISVTGGYNKDVETRTVATNIEQLSVREFFIHKPVSRLVATDGSLFSLSKPIGDLAEMPDDRKHQEQVLKCHMYHLHRKKFPAGAIHVCLHSAPAG